MTGRKRMTSAAGVPVAANQNSLTAGPRGPVPMADYQLMEEMAHFNRERVPERVVHAKGAGAYGRFSVTGDISRYTCAKTLSKVGNSCETIVRFSTVAGEQGSADTAGDPRGCAVKFYTGEGNRDMVGNNTPVFFIRDRLKFSDFIHSQTRDPRTGMRDATMQWDFWSLSPASMHQVTCLFGDRGISASHRHMNGYSSHTFSLSPGPHSALARQGCTRRTADPAATARSDHPDPRSRWPASPLRPTGGVVQNRRSTGLLPHAHGTVSPLPSRFRSSARIRLTGRPREVDGPEDAGGPGSHLDKVRSLGSLGEPRDCPSESDEVSAKDKAASTSANDGFGPPRSASSSRGGGAEEAGGRPSARGGSRAGH